MYAGIVLDPLVEGGDGAVFVGLRVEDATAPEDVVDSDDTPGSQKLDGLLVVGGVAGLVGVDEDDIKDPVVEGFQGIERGTEAEVDLVAVRTLGVELPGDLRQPPGRCHR